MSSDSKEWEDFLKYVSRISHTKIHPPVYKASRQAFHQLRQRQPEEIDVALYTNSTPRQYGLKDVRHVTIEGCIDLHGYTLIQAENTLKKFILQSHRKGHRWVIVITGKGTNLESLRYSVPKWLDLWSIIIGYTHAPLSEGGEGALYVHIRKVSRENR